MKIIAEVSVKDKTYRFDLTKPLDISIPVRNKNHSVNAWGSGYPEMSPVVSGDFYGAVKKGKGVNFRNIFFNPHSHGTHTECIGHITGKVYSVNKLLRNYFFMAELVSIRPEKSGNNRMITQQQVKTAIGIKAPEALVIRTLPNHLKKTKMNYTNIHPPFLAPAAADFIKRRNISHLLVDLPSIDPEYDGGKLKSHRAFWNFSGKRRKNATVTEMIFVPDKIPDGTYLLNLMIAGFENDATPCKPVLYKIISQF